MCVERGGWGFTCLISGKCLLFVKESRCHCILIVIIWMVQSNDNWQVASHIYSVSLAWYTEWSTHMGLPYSMFSFHFSSTYSISFIALKHIINNNNYYRFSASSILHKWLSILDFKLHPLFSNVFFLSIFISIQIAWIHTSCSPIW